MSNRNEYTSSTIVAAYRAKLINKNAARKYIMAQISNLVLSGGDAKPWAYALQELEAVNPSTPDRDEPTVDDYVAAIAERAWLLGAVYSDLALGHWVPQDMPESMTAEYLDKINSAVESYKLPEQITPRIESGRRKLDAWATRDAIGGGRSTPSNMAIVSANSGSIPQRGKLPLHVRALIENGHAPELNETVPLSWVRSAATLYYTETEINNLGLPNNPSVDASLKNNKLPGFVRTCDERGRNVRMRYIGIQTWEQENTEREREAARAIETADLIQEDQASTESTESTESAANSTE